MRSISVRPAPNRGPRTWTRSVRKGRSRSFLAVLTLPLIWSLLTVPVPSLGSAPPPADVAFVALGNAGTGSAGQLALRDQMVRRARDFDLALFLGNSGDPSGSYADHGLNFFGTYGTLFQAQGQPPPRPSRASPKPAYAVAGDDDVRSDPTAAGFLGSFVLPRNGPSQVEPERFYTFDVGGVHFVAFDSTVVTDPRTTAGTLDSIRSWLVADLGAHAGDVTILYSHGGAFLAGTGRGGGSDDPMRSVWFPLFEAHGVDLILSGAERNYQRNVALGGVTTYVVGSGGAVPAAVVPAPFTAASLVDDAFLSVTVNGCVISTTAVRGNGTEFDPWTFTAPTCRATPGRGELFADSFETGDFTGWSTVQVGPGGAATVDEASAHPGGLAGRLVASALPTSYAYARKQLQTPSANLVVAGTFRVVGEGPPDGNVPLFRLFDDQGSRILSLYRQNASGSRIYVQHGGRFNTTTGVVPLGTWARLEVRIRLNGPSSTIEVRLNNALIYQSGTTTLTEQAVSRIQIGNDTVGQAFDMLVDDVSASDGGSVNAAEPSRASPPPSLPEPTAPPTIAPIMTPPPVTPTPLTVTILDEGFESGGLRPWTITTTGDGTATVGRSSVASGTFAAHLFVGSTPGSSSAIRQFFAYPRSRLTISADVRVASDGPKGGNVPLLRVYDAQRNRVISIHRQNANSDRIYIVFDGIAYQTTGRIPVGSWASVELDVALGADTSAIQLSIDDVVVFDAPNAALGSRGVAAFQFGNELKSQPMDLFVDNVRILEG